MGPQLRPSSRLSHLLTYRADLGQRRLEVVGGTSLGLANADSLLVGAGWGQPTRRAVAPG